MFRIVLAALAVAGAGYSLSAAEAPATTRAAATRPAAPLPIVGWFGSLPDHLRPKAGETARTIAERRDWLTARAKGRRLSGIMKVEGFTVAQKEGEVCPFGKLKDVPAWAADPQLGGVDLHMTLEPGQAKFFEGDSVLVTGELAEVTTGPVIDRNGVNSVTLVKGEILRVIPAPRKP